MRGVVDIDGQRVPAGQAKISVFDRGFLYGDSAFEAMRTYGGRVFRERDHLERLAASCQLLRMALPVSLEEISRRIADAARELGDEDCYVRVLVTRGIGPMGLDLGQAQHPSVLVYALELKLPPPELYERGIELGIVHTGRSTDGTAASGAKHSNYLASVLALDDVKKRGAAEALILGRHGEVAEGASSNVFVVCDGALTTPPLSAGILEGITRRVVFEVASELGVSCRETQLFPGDLYRADEVFITSSIRELMPAVQVDDVRIGDGHPGPLYRRLHRAYRARTVAE